MNSIDAAAMIDQPEIALAAEILLWQEAGDAAREAACRDRIARDWPPDVRNKVLVLLEGIAQLQAMQQAQGDGQ